MFRTPVSNKEVRDRSGCLASVDCQPREPPNDFHYVKEPSQRYAAIKNLKC